MTIIIRIKDGIVQEVLCNEPIAEVIIEDLDGSGHVDIDGNDVGYTDFWPSLHPGVVAAISRHYTRGITERLED